METVREVTQTGSDGKPKGSELYLPIRTSSRSAILSLKEVVWEAEQFILRVTNLQNLRGGGTQVHKRVWEKNDGVHIHRLLRWPRFSDLTPGHVLLLARSHHRSFLIWMSFLCILLGKKGVGEEFSHVANS